MHNIATAELTIQQTDQHAQVARVSVVVPSWSGEIGRLRASLEAQTYHDYELIVVQAESPAGRARNLGVAQARGELIVFIDDDAYFGHEHVLEMMIATLDADPTIGVVGPSKVLSPGATWLQRRIAKEVPRWIYPIVDQDTESNPPLDSYGYTDITTTCAVMRRAAFEQIGGFDEQLTTGPEDTEFFYRVRQAGYRFVIPADCWVHHDSPGSLGMLLRKSFRYGVGHAQEARKAPERGMDILRLERWYGKLLVLFSPLLFVPSLFISFYFYPKRHLRVGFRPLKALSTYATLYGYAWGWWRAAGIPAKASVVSTFAESTLHYTMLPDQAIVEKVRKMTRLTSPRVSVVIPSRRGKIEQLQASLEAQTYQDYELIVVQGVAPAGRARNQGVTSSEGELMLFIDDDATLGHPRVLEQLVAVLESDPTIGVVGPSKILSPQASPLQRRIAAEIPRWVYPVVDDDTESNPATDRYGFTGITTTCCLMRRSVVDQVGGFRDDLRTGQDTEFFYRVRRAGYRFMIPHDCWVYHDPPGRLGALLRKSFYNGVGHAREARLAPERHMDVVPLDRWYGKLAVLLAPLLFPFSLLVNFYFDPQHHWRVGFHPLKALSTYATLYGYVWGWYGAR
jgi:GT2 family glycosyltransferase